MPTNTSMCAQMLSAVKHAVYTKEIEGDVGGASPVYELLVVKGCKQKDRWLPTRGRGLCSGSFSSLRFFMFSTWFL